MGGVRLEFGLLAIPFSWEEAENDDQVEDVGLIAEESIAAMGPEMRHLLLELSQARSKSDARKNLRIVRSE
jgi:hypothetical protein